MGLCLERGAEMVTAVLGTWLAGAAYLPLDPGLSARRLAYMLAASGAAAGAARAGCRAGCAVPAGDGGRGPPIPQVAGQLAGMPAGVPRVRAARWAWRM